MVLAFLFGLRLENVVGYVWVLGVHWVQAWVILGLM